MTASEKSQTVDVAIDPAHLTPAQKKFHSIRFPKLDQESTMDFLEGFKRYRSMLGGSATAALIPHWDQHLRSLGHDPDADTKLNYQESFDLMMRDPVFAADVCLEWSAQDIMWDRAFRYFNADAEKYLKAMEETDKAGPGTLELNPAMRVPEYTSHEIHRQPGGYVGDAFGGWVYHYALALAYYMGRSEHDELHLALAQNFNPPADGKVTRVLEIGCASGLTTTALKERFPNAEVWGIDVGGPMVRYAHHRAVKKGIDVNFAQRLAEDTKFPDNHFDVVMDFLMFHEVSDFATRKIVPEMHRILRPGGIWNHNDVVTRGQPIRKPNDTVRGKAMTWNTHRHNYEPWFLQFTNADMPGYMRQAGFEVDASAQPLRGEQLSGNRLLATKPA